MMSNSNLIFIGPDALTKLINAIEKAYCAGENSHLDAQYYLVRGVSALVEHTDAEVTIENENRKWSFRDCEELSDIASLLEASGGVFRIEFSNGMEASAS